MPVQEFSLRDLADRLDRVSDEVRLACSQEAQAAADATVRRTRAAYPVVKGNLVRSVRRGTPRSFAVTASGLPVPSAVAVVTAPHLHFYEEGAGLKHPRRDPTRGNAYRGVAPAHGEIFVGIAIEEREGMFARVEAILNRDEELV